MWRKWVESRRVRLLKSNREALAISVLDMENFACIGQGAISSTQHNKLCYRAEETRLAYTYDRAIKSLLIGEDARFFVHRRQVRPVSLLSRHTSSVETESRTSALLLIARGCWQTPSWNHSTEAPSSMPAVKLPESVNPAEQELYDQSQSTRTLM